MTIQKALLRAVAKLQTKKFTMAHLDADVLLSAILKRPKSFLQINLEKELTTTQHTKFKTYVEKRLTGIPVAYLINHKEFYKLDFFIDKNVLVPRPATETLVEETIKSARHLHATKPKEILTIADIGTGSGCIAVTLAKYLPYTKIIATDISKHAIMIAKKNARDHKVLNRITFKTGDLLKPLKKFKVDIIVSNLPYLTKDETDKVKHEPKKALYGGKMGIELIEKLLTKVEKIITKDSIILLEISPTQTKIIEYIVQQHHPKKSTWYIKDLSGYDRVVKIK